MVCLTLYLVGGFHRRASATRRILVVSIHSVWRFFHSARPADRSWLEASENILNSVHHSFDFISGGPRESSHA